MIVNFAVNTLTLAYILKINLIRILHKSHLNMILNENSNNKYKLKRIH